MKRKLNLRKADTVTILASGGAAVVLLIIVRALSGAPYETLHICGIDRIIPPVRLFAVLWSVWYFLIGAQLAFVLSSGRASDIRALRGAITWVACILTGAFFYPAFFTSRAFLLGALIAACVLVLAILSLAAWRELPFVYSVIPILYCLWTIYASVISAVAVFNC